MALELEISSSLGLADDDGLNSDDMIRTIKAISRVTGKPLVVDAGNGRVLDQHLLEAISETAQPATIVLDDTVYPRSNSFMSHPNRVLDSAAVADRLNRHVATAKSHPAVSLCFRTEVYRSNGKSLARTAEHVQRVLAEATERPDFLLVHGVNVCKPTDREAVAGLGVPFIALSTLSPGATVSQFASAGAAILVLPNILTIQRHFEARRLLQEVLTSRSSVDGPYPPFVELVSDLTMLANHD